MCAPSRLADSNWILDVLLASEQIDTCTKGTLNHMRDLEILRSEDLRLALIGCAAQQSTACGISSRGAV